MPRRVLRVDGNLVRREGADEQAAHGVDLRTLLLGHDVRKARVQ